MYKTLVCASLAVLAARLEAAPGSSLAGQEGSRPVVQIATASEGAAFAPAAARDWILKTSDNICGLRDANQLTHPAQIDFDTCLQATPEMRRIKDQGIDPKSAEGIQLRSAAVTRVTDACERVRSAQGHCSIWKEIRHKDGRAIPDLSSQVMALF